AVRVQHHGYGRRRQVRVEVGRQGIGVRSAVDRRLLLLETPRAEEPFGGRQGGRAAHPQERRAGGDAYAGASGGEAAQGSLVPTQSLGTGWSRRAGARGSSRL